jgi:hypothetical protein
MVLPAPWLAARFSDVTVPIFMFACAAAGDAEVKALTYTVLNAAFD